MVGLAFLSGLGSRGSRFPEVLLGQPAVWQWGRAGRSLHLLLGGFHWAGTCQALPQQGCPPEFPHACSL